MCCSFGIASLAVRQLCALLMLTIPTVCTAAENPGIAVVGSGKIMAKPTQVELTAIVKGEAELAVDAITKYEDNKRRALEAIGNLGIADLSVSGGGVSINSAEAQAAMMAAMRGMPPAEDSTQKLSLSETLTLKLLKIDALSTQDLLQTLVKIVDAGKDAGLTIGPPPKSMYELQIAAQTGNAQSPLAAFKLADVASVKGQAYEAAILDARTQAERLANLAGVKLGRVTAIREVTDKKSGPDFNPYYGWMMAKKEPEYVSSGLAEIAVAVVLEVEFAIE
jgi:uncharacterized protein YggE